MLGVCVLSACSVCYVFMSRPCYGMGVFDMYGIVISKRCVMCIIYTYQTFFARISCRVLYHCNGSH